MIVPSAQTMLDFARPGDTIVVWRLDRLGRSLTHLIETVMGLQARGSNFRRAVLQKISRSGSALSREICHREEKLVSLS